MKILLGLILVTSLTFVTTFDDYSSSSSNESSECQISYKYVIWIGDNIEEIHSVKLESECGTVFFDAMQQASEKKSEFMFEHSKHPLYGAFLTKIAGIANDEDETTYWMIYDLTTTPDINNVPDDSYLAPDGLNALEVLDGHSYLFWYRTVTWDDDDNDNDDDNE